jgi:aspartyl-tRNA(Asn)/glutamyl-tRNA(Gln) amidotransferase subunit A
MGKSNLDEFAMGFTTETSAFGPTLNPYDKTRVSGGSSGGSAAAVASGMVAFALGSDTGGSVRQPASFCNIVGFKPSYGRFSRYGLVAFASSLDHIGTLTKTVDDAVELYKILGGHDVMDSTSIHEKINLKPGFQDRDWQSLRIGYLKEIASSDMHPAINESFDNALKFFEKKTRKVRSFRFPLLDTVVACYYIIAPSECSANLARYDGIRYGPGLEEGEYDNLLDYYFKVRGKGFGDEVRRRILVGTFSLCSGYYDAYYLKANQVRGMIIEEFEKIFKEVDILVSPTYPALPWKIGRFREDPVALYNSDLFTIPPNLTGYPSISIPGGFSPEGLPIGIMLMSRYKDEENLFRVAKIFEQNNPFYLRSPF